MVNKKLDRYFNSQIFKFLIVGMTTVFIDYIFYYCLFLIGITTDISKGVSFIIGAIFAYVANKYFTFNYYEYSNRSILFFCILYLISLTVNIYTNEFFLRSLSNLIFNFEISFIVATMISAAINFIGMKYIVFKN